MVRGKEGMTVLYPTEGGDPSHPLGSSLPLVSPGRYSAFLWRKLFSNKMSLGAQNIGPLLPLRYNHLSPSLALLLRMLPVVPET